mmetsp:Transcript_69815/g.185547  ORF Transcript_69815/g.185547 Transcript_69815/m.185547 type:complete len:414 (-) Transcript_69815:181-1422(-)
MGNRRECQLDGQLVEIHRAPHALLVHKQLHHGDLDHLRLGYGTGEGQPTQPLKAVQVSPPPTSVILQGCHWVAQAAVHIPVLTADEERVRPSLRGRGALGDLRLEEGADEVPGLVGETRPRPGLRVDLTECRKSNHLVLPGRELGDPERRVEGAVAHEQEVGDDADAPHVAAAAQRLGYATQVHADHWWVQLGRGIPQGADALGGNRRPALSRLQDDRPAKVGKLHLRNGHGVQRRPVEEQVLWLHVAVLHAALDQVLDREDQLADELQDVGLQHAAPIVGGVELVHVSAIAMLQHQDILVTVALVALQQPQYVRVDSHPRQGQQLLLEHQGAGFVEPLEGDSPASRSPGLLGVAVPRPLARGPAPGAAVVAGGQRPLDTRSSGKGLEDRGRLPRAQLAAEDVAPAPLGGAFY